MHNEALLLVASQSHPRTLAGAVAALVRDGKTPVLQAVGAGVDQQQSTGKEPGCSTVEWGKAVLLAGAS